MNISTRFSLRPLALAGAALLLLAAAPDRASAAFVFTLSQVGGNVTVTGTGTFNTTALTLQTNTTGNAQIVASTAALFAGPAGVLNTAVYRGGGLTGPTAFGTGGNFATTSGTGGLIGINGGSTYLLLPQNYTSGTTVSDSSVFNGQTFATIGFTPGTYVYTWGTGANADSLTVTGAVPEPSTWALLGVGAGLLGLILRQRHSRAA